MCGIYGFALADDQQLDRPTAAKLFRSLAICSESRGKEASGFAAVQDGSIKVYKCPWPSERMLVSQPFKHVFGSSAGTSGLPMAIGHSRLVTNGFEGVNTNNQPVLGLESVAIHNGIVVNFRAVWEKHFRGEVPSELDTRVLVALVEKFLAETGSVASALRRAYSEIDGMAAVALLFSGADSLVLATNNGSLYYVFDAPRRMMVFASERGILRRAVERAGMAHRFAVEDITQLQSGSALIFPSSAGQPSLFRLGEDASISVEPPRAPIPRSLVDLSDSSPAPELRQRLNLAPKSGVRQRWAAAFDGWQRQIDSLRRCTECILPATFPFIEFDALGRCNYCANYRRMTFRGREALEELLARRKPSGAGGHAVVSFSGGRDSSYCLYYLKEVLGLKPVAITYDWGMITDLARRNQSRLCGRLGIEHILVSADIRRKRANIKLNVEAWLRRPTLGTVPLFMAGDKQFIYHAQRTSQELKIPVLLFGENRLERTNFKSGYCGIRPEFAKDKIYTLPLEAKARMGLFYLHEYVRNPAYLNRSLLDTLGAFGSYYVMAHTFVNFFEYIEWNEQVIDKTLRERLDWESADDLKSTWRIGDGTAAFYNYIYYTVGGFSEFDTFRSNQIREGLITRETALAQARSENEPRYESIRWYCDTIDIDFESTVDRINKIPRRFGRAG